MYREIPDDGVLDVLTPRLVEGIKKLKKKDKKKKKA